jgi:large subunit ribosomal protein L15
MDLNTLKGKPRTRKKPMVRKGRGPGTGKGKTAGRGGKGASARTGFTHRYYFEGGQMPLVRRLPKFGFNNKIFRTDIVVLNVRSLAEFDDGATVGPQEFLKAGMINKVADGVKVLGDGELTKKLTVQAHRFSESAKKKIEAAGGKCEVIEAKAAAVAEPKAEPKARPAAKADAKPEAKAAKPKKADAKAADAGAKEDKPAPKAKPKKKE